MEKKLNFFQMKLFKKFDLCFSSKYMKHKKDLKFLGAKKIKNLGNLKFSTSKKS